MKGIKQLAIALMALASHQVMAQDFDFNEVTYTPEKTTFRLFAPRHAKVYVEYGNPADAKPKTVKMKLGADGVWTAVVKKDLNHRNYRFKVDGMYSNGVFAKAVGMNGAYAQVLDLSETDPEHWCCDQRLETASPTDLIIYELHHRDFSIARNINLDAGEIFAKRQSSEHPGKFLALTEDWAISHLKELGVNAVHILPSYDFGSVDESRLDTPQYNWGYDPVNYNVPEGSYSTDPADPKCRIREFKQMVQALHNAGIRVILDVVYNHTYDIEHSNFQRTYPDYYYRGERREVSGEKGAARGESRLVSYSNGSGCGNETASDQPMMRRFMIESVKYWATEYHIDGFRFDLMGVHDIETMNEIRRALDEIDPNIFMYGEGWSAGTCAYPQEKLAMKANIRQMPRIAAFSDDIRDALRGPFSDDTKGAFLAGIAGEEESLKAGIAGMIAHPQVDYSKVNYSKEPYATEPTQMIAYVSCHDDMCLVDRLKASIPTLQTADGKLSESQMQELIRLDLLAQTAVLTSQGVPFMLSGEELLRDKKGVHNSFESPDSINQLNWNNRIKYPQVFDYYKNLIQLRKNHPAFRLGKADLVRKHLEFLPVQDCLVAFRLKDHAGGDAWGDIIVVLNGSKEAQSVEIPDDNYTVVCCDGVISEQGLGEIKGNNITVDAQSALIIHN